MIVDRLAHHIVGVKAFTEYIGKRKNITNSLLSTWVMDEYFGGTAWYRFTTTYGIKIHKIKKI